jgi:hypothetical protein
MSRASISIIQSRAYLHVRVTFDSGILLAELSDEQKNDVA